MIVHGVAKSPVISACSLHSHDCWEVVVNLSGRGVERIGEEEEAFYPGSVSVYPPHVPHIKRCDRGETWQDVYLRFSDESFSLKQLRHTDDIDHTMARLLDMLQSACARNNTDTAGFSGALGSAVCALLRQWEAHQPGDALTERVKSEISCRFTDPEFQVRRAMEGMGYCEDYLRRRFHRATGQTPTEYLTGMRLSHAKMLLSQDGSSGMSVREIANLCGFYDADYFSRVFRKLCGCSPTRYREAIANVRPDGAR